MYFRILVWISYNCSIGFFFRNCNSYSNFNSFLPITLLLTRKDRKNSDDIYDRLQAVKKKGDDYLLECSLAEQLDESRNKIGTKMNIIIIFHIIAITILIIYFYIFM